MLILKQQWTDKQTSNKLCHKIHIFENIIHVLNIQNFTMYCLLKWVIYIWIWVPHL